MTSCVLMCASMLVCVRRVCRLVVVELFHLFALGDYIL